MSKTFVMNSHKIDNKKLLVNYHIPPAIVEVANMESGWALLEAFLPLKIHIKDHTQLPLFFYNLMGISV